MIRRVWRVVVIAWALRTSWLTVAYVLGWSDVARHHVETAGFILAGLLLITTGVLWFAGELGFHSLLLSGRLKPAPTTPTLAGRLKPAATTLPLSGRLKPAATTLPFVLLVVAYAAYWPALWVGLLSDDFVLLDRAAAGRLIDPGWEMVRPLPLALWGALARVMPDLWLPPVLHALNIGLHAVNAWLIALLMRRFTDSTAIAMIAAAAFLLFPASVEAVAWISGIFDVLLTTLVLVAACLAVSTWRPAASTWAAIGITGLALATKETAITLPALIIVAAWLGSRLAAKQTWMMAIGSAVVVLAYVGWRVASGTTAAAFPPLDGYAAKELLTRPFAALILPFHESFLHSAPVIVAACAAAVPLLLAGRLVLPAQPAAQLTQSVIGVPLWVLAATGPVFTWLFVGPDLQGARYVYLASAGWSMLLAAAVTPGARWRPWAATLAGLMVAVWLAVSALAVRDHLTHWTEAARSRDAAIAAAMSADPSCASPPPASPPQDVRGAYVFRNGFAEALRRECRRLQVR